MTHRSPALGKSMTRFNCQTRVATEAAPWPDCRRVDEQRVFSLYRAGMEIALPLLAHGNCRPIIRIADHQADARDAARARRPCRGKRCSVR